MTVFENFINSQHCKTREKRTFLTNPKSEKLYFVLKPVRLFTTLFAYTAKAIRNFIKNAMIGLKKCYIFTTSAFLNSDLDLDKRNVFWLELKSVRFNL